MNYKELFIDKDDVLLIRKELVRVLGDLNEAVILNQLNYWIEINRKAKKNLHDGRYWVFNTYQTWKETDFDFWSTDTIRRTLTRLENKGIVLTGNYNKMKIDKTKWYTIDYEKLQELINEHEKKQIANKEKADCVNDMANCADGNGSISKAIPENTTENNNRDYSTENTDNYTPEEKTSSGGNIYTSVPEEQEGHTKKPNRYIPPDYTEEQLREHIRPTIEENYERLEQEYDAKPNPEYNPDGKKLIEDITVEFFRQYEENTGQKHRILPDKSYINVIERFISARYDVLDGFGFDEYRMMIENYFNTDFDQRGHYGKEITLSLSHFMSYKILLFLTNREGIAWERCEDD